MKPKSTASKSKAKIQEGPKQILIRKTEAIGTEGTVENMTRSNTRFHNNINIYLYPIVYYLRINEYNSVRELSI